MSDLCQKRTLRMTPKKGFNGESECDLLSKDPVSILLASVFFPQELFLTLSNKLCPMSDLCQMRTLRMTPKIGFNGKSEFDLLSKDPFSILLASVFFPQELFLTLSNSVQSRTSVKCGLCAWLPKKSLVASQNLSFSASKDRSEMNVTLTLLLIIV